MLIDLSINYSADQTLKEASRKGFDRTPGELTQTPPVGMLGGMNVSV
jgi:hypothetical protein